MNNFFKRLLDTDQLRVATNEDFWDWFVKNEGSFYETVKSQTDIEKGFFNKLEPQLDQLKDGYFYLAGMLDENIAELILTSDGNIANFVFVERLIDAAPQLKGWKFTALKPPGGVEQFEIQMNGYRYITDNLYFYSNVDSKQPDEVDITMVYDHLTEENRDEVSTGIFIFLDNFLGELNFATLIDNVFFEAKTDVKQDLIPISKLKSFLIWREKEFVEKYEQTYIDTSDHQLSIFKGESKNGNALFATMNTTLLAWDNKASHPWMLKFALPYDGSENEGLPKGDGFNLLNTIEDEMLAKLLDKNGHLNIGRETAGNVRYIYFACNEYRECSLIAYEIVQKYKDSLDITYEIYKDKYWQSLANFES